MKKIMLLHERPCGRHLARLLLYFLLQFNSAFSSRRKGIEHVFLSFYPFNIHGEVKGPFLWGTEIGVYAVVGIDGWYKAFALGTGC